MITFSCGIHLASADGSVKDGQVQVLKLISDLHPGDAIFLGGTWSLRPRVSNTPGFDLTYLTCVPSYSLQAPPPGAFHPVYSSTTRVGYITLPKWVGSSITIEKGYFRRRVFGRGMVKEGLA